MHTAIILIIGRIFSDALFSGRKEFVGILETIPHPALNKPERFKLYNKNTHSQIRRDYDFLPQLSVPCCCDIHRVTLIRINKIKYVIIDS